MEGKGSQRARLHSQKEMEILIIAICGLIAGSVLNKNSSSWWFDITYATLGSVATYGFFKSTWFFDEYLNFMPFALFFSMAGAVVVVYALRSLRN